MLDLHKPKFKMHFSWKTFVSNTKVLFPLGAFGIYVVTKIRLLSMFVEYINIQFDYCQMQTYYTTFFFLSLAPIKHPE